MQTLIFSDICNTGYGKNAGAYLIATHLRNNNFSCQVVDYFTHYTLDELKKIVDKFVSKDTLWVGFSTTFLSYFDTDLNSKDLRVFSIRAQDTGDLISTAAYSYVNGIQTSSVTQTNLSTFTAPNSIANLGGIDDGDSLNTYRGYFGEIIIFNELHSIDTHTKVINFLKERWNIT
jgi:hypothetical protein